MEKRQKEWAEILAREQDQRISIDYDVDFELDPEQAASIVRDARRFLDRMRKHLAAKGVSVAARKNRK